MRNKTIQEILDSTPEEVKEFVALYAMNIISKPIDSFTYTELPELEELYKEAIDNKKEAFIYKETLLLTSYIGIIINELKSIQNV